MAPTYHDNILPVGGKKIRFWSDSIQVSVAALRIEEGPHTGSEGFDVYIPTGINSIPSGISMSYAKSTSVLTTTITSPGGSIAGNVTLPDASISSRGMVNTAAQSFAGNKTFTGSTTLGDASRDLTTVNGDTLLNNRLRINAGITLPTSATGTTTNLIAASTIDLYSYIRINQTNPLANYVIPAPTVSTPGLHLYVSNTGTAPFSVDSVNLVPAGKTLHMVRDGTVWSEIINNYLEYTNSYASTATIGALFTNVFATNGATAITLTMPPHIAGKKVRVCRGVGSTGTVTILPGTGQIEALANTLGATTSLANANQYGQNVWFMSDGTNWLRIMNG